MDVIYKIEIDTPDGDVEIEVSVEDGDFVSLWKIS